LRQSLSHYQTVERLEEVTARRAAESLLSRVGIDASRLQGMNVLFPTRPGEVGGQGEHGSAHITRTGSGSMRGWVLEKCGGNASEAARIVEGIQRYYMEDYVVFGGR